MADWVHCNKCFISVTRQEVKFILTNCGHIICEKCFKMMPPNICYICHRECTTIYLSSNLSADIQPYFEDVHELTMKFANIIEFQKNHRLKFLDHMLKENIMLKNKYLCSKEYIVKIIKQNELLKKDTQRLRSILKTQIQSPSFTYTPPPQPSKSSSAKYNPPRTLSSGNSSRFVCRGQPSHNWNTSSRKNSSSTLMMNTPPNSPYIHSSDRSSSSHSEAIRTGSSVYNGSIYSNATPSTSTLNVSNFSKPSDRPTPKYHI